MKQEKLGSYWDCRFSREVVKILPGEYFVCKDTRMIVTVLGSCVAACIRDKELKIGGMNHFMLPQAGRYAHHRVAVVDDSDAARYGNVAMERLVNDILKMGGRRKNLTAKIFGGGRITNATVDIGGDNINFVYDYLGLEGITILSEDVGGTLPRKVYYIPETDDVFIKKIERMNNDTITRRENSYIQSLNKKDTEGEVTFLND